MNSDNVKIDKEIESLIPPSTADELRLLRESIEANGCLHDLVAWREEDILLDGHQRRTICKELGRPFRVRSLSFADRPAAMLWVLRNQMGRRNLTDYARAAIALKMEPLLAEAAENRRLANLKPASTDTERANLPVRENQPETQKRARDEVGESVSLSGKTIASVKQIEEKGTEALRALATAGAVSIDAAAKVATLPPAQQERIAAKGPGAVKEKASEIRKALAERKPAPKADPDPWGEYNAMIDEVIRLLDETGSLVQALTKSKGVSAAFTGWINGPKFRTFFDNAVAQFKGHKVVRFATEQEQRRLPKGQNFIYAKEAKATDRRRSA